MSIIKRIKRTIRERIKIRIGGPASYRLTKRNKILGYPDQPRRELYFSVHKLWGIIVLTKGKSWEPGKTEEAED